MENIPKMDKCPMRQNMMSHQHRFLFHSNPLNATMDFFYSCGCFVILSPLFPCTFVRKGDEKSAGGSRLGRLPKIIFFSRFVTSSKTADHPGLESLINN